MSQKAKFRTIDARLFYDRKFLAFGDEARQVWTFLLLGPHHEGMPGLYHLGQAQAAEQLRRSVDWFQRGWEEIERAGMARADWENRVVFLPNAVRLDPPDNRNVLQGWIKRLPTFDESELAATWLEGTMQAVANKGHADWLEGMEEQIETAMKPLRNHGGTPAKPREAGIASGSRKPEAGTPSPDPDPEASKRKKEAGESLAAGAPRASGLEVLSMTKKEKEEERERTWRAWVEDLKRGEGINPELVEIYIGALEDGLTAFWQQRGGRFTWNKRKYIARGLEKYGPTNALIAIESFVDSHIGTKDERYLVGIARGHSKLTRQEFERDNASHRKRFAGRGIWDEFQQRGSTTHAAIR